MARADEQVGGGGDGQELGQPLEDAQDSRPGQIEQVQASPCPALSGATMQLRRVQAHARGSGISPFSRDDYKAVLLLKHDFCLKRRRSGHREIIFPQLRHRRRSWPNACRNLCLSGRTGPKSARRRSGGRFPRNPPRIHCRKGRRAGRALRPMRRAVLPDPLPAAEQHPRLAEAHGRGAAGGGLLGSAATNPMPEMCGRICPQDRLCEGACVIEQIRARRGDDRRGREVSDRNGVARRLGGADPPRARAQREHRHYRRRARRGSPRPSACACAAIR